MAQGNQQLIKDLLTDAEGFFWKAAKLLFPPVNVATGKVFNSINTFRLVQSDAHSTCPMVITCNGLINLDATMLKDVLCSVDPVMSAVILDLIRSDRPKQKRNEKPKVIRTHPIKMHVLQPRSFHNDDGEPRAEMTYRWITYFSLGNCNSSMATFAWKTYKYVERGLSRIRCHSSLSQLIWDVLDNAVFVLDRFYDPKSFDTFTSLPSCCLKICYECDTEEDNVYCKNVVCDENIDQYSDFEDLLTIVIKILKRQMQVLGMKWREPKLSSTKRRRPLRASESLPKRLLLYWSSVRLVTLLCAQRNERVTDYMKEVMRRLCHLDKEEFNVESDIILATATRISLPVARLVDKLVNWILFGFNRYNMQRQMVSLCCAKHVSEGSEDLHIVRFIAKKTFPTLFIM